MDVKIDIYLPSKALLICAKLVSVTTARLCPDANARFSATSDVSVSLCPGGSARFNCTKSRAFVIT